MPGLRDPAYTCTVGRTSQVRRGVRSVVEELELDGELVCAFHAVRLDLAPRGLDVRVVRGPPVVGAERPPVLVAGVGAGDVLGAELQDGRQPVILEEIPELS